MEDMVFDCPECKVEMDIVDEYSELDIDVYFINYHMKCPVCHKKYCVTEHFIREGYTREEE